MLELEDDAANANLGVGYRIPTREDWEELLDNCKWEAVTTTLPVIMDPSQTKVIARWIVTGPNGKSIILPMTDSFRSDAWITSDEDTYYTTANLWPAEGLSDGKKYRKAVALAWPFLLKRHQAEVSRSQRLDLCTVHLVLWYDRYSTATQINKCLIKDMM